MSQSTPSALSSLVVADPASVLVVSATSELPPLLASAGVRGDLTKPFDMDAIVEAVGRVAVAERGG